MSQEPFRSQALFASEADLRRAFMKQIPDGWKAYLDHGFDILLVRSADGAQIGVTIKLGLPDELNIIPRTLGAKDGPDYEAVLIPWGTTGGHRDYCEAHGVTVIEMRDREMYLYEKSASGRAKKFNPDLPQEGAIYWGFRPEWYRLYPVNRLALSDAVAP